ncbi:DUF2007 domain-containing protein [Planctomicrobium sp. SH668]|uniref:putative signal transducing protein n=1 Tax=Planctomicrobium sp. SH668 TaxID=3448126 RepID=UPI003F5BF393
MRDERLVAIYKTPDVGRAEVIKSALQTIGIQCSIENENQGGFAGVLQCRLFVFESDEAQAREFIAEHESVHE